MIRIDKLEVSPREPALWLAAIAAVAALALLSALTLQFVFGLAPCQLCLWERWPYLIVIALAIGGLLMEVPRTALAIVLLALLGGIGLAGFHVGVEQGIFALPETCASAGRAQSTEELLRQLDEAAPRCDQVSASLLGLSLAAWNLVLVTALAAAAVLGLCFARVRS